MAHSWEHLEGYQKFRALLSELFQFDLADLDFGLYRLLKQRRRAIEEYFAEELPKRLSEHIHALDQQAKADIEAERKAAIDRLRQLAPSAIEPDGTLAPIADTLAQAGGQIGDLILRIRQIDSILSKWELAENQVNDALLLVHDFFRRYYDEGDFIPQPRFSHGEGYAIESYRDCALAPLPQDFPGAVYHGEDTYFHWPTRGMHYAKSDTYLKNYTFQVETQGPEPQTFTVQFVLADVEPVRDNNRVTRYFFPKPKVRLEGHTLTIPFDYRSKREGDPANQEKILETTLPAVLASIPDPNLRAALENTGENGKSLLHRRARHFSALGSKDFFIHPRLEDFLQAELDYFTKSQALRHAELGDDRLLRRRLATLKAFRGIAQDLIRFLGQLERIQTQLFEKKRLVYRTDYIVPIRYVPKSLWPEILANKAQIRCWQKDMGLTKIDQGVLETHPSLPVFTGHFDPGFARKLLAALSERWDLDEITDGVLVHGENYGALRTLEARWREQVKCIYIDPPYNTGSDGFIYKDRYRHSSWLSMMLDRLTLARELLREDGAIFISCDDHEVHHLRKIGDSLWQAIGTFVWEKKKKGSHLSPIFRDLTEYILAYTPDLSKIGKLFGEKAYSGKWQYLINRSNTERELLFPAKKVHAQLGDGTHQAGTYGEGEMAVHLLDDIIVQDGIVQNQFRMRARFKWKQEKLDEELEKGSIVKLSKNMRPNVLRADQEEKTKRPPSLITKDIATYEDAFAELSNLFGEVTYPYPKPVGLVRFFINAMTYFNPQGIVLDFFAGSGTTAHGVIQLNREDGGQRRFILVEMGDYFDSVLLKRVQKVMYAPTWSGGKPKPEPMVDGASPLPQWMERSPRLVKVLRLESYEDALFNLQTEPSPREKAYEENLSAVERPHEFLPHENAYLLSYFAEVVRDGNPTLLRPMLNGEVLTEWHDPEAIRIKRPERGGYREEEVDWLETAALWLGLRVRKYAEMEANGHLYRVMYATSPDGGQPVALILRKRTPDLDLHGERVWLESTFPGHRVILNAPPTAGFESLEEVLLDAMMEGPK